MWTHKDLVEDRFDFSDLLDAHEALDVQAETEARAQQYLESLKKR